MPRLNADPPHRGSHTHERSASSYNRRTGHRSPGKWTLIVCEGTTEKIYFEALRLYLKLSLVQTMVCSRDPLSLVSKAKQVVEKRVEEFRKQKTIEPFEVVWCVFDVENPHCNVRLNQAVLNADQSHYALAISNPAFEFWFVLHFEFSTRPFQDGQEIKQYLCDHWIPGYFESMPVFSRLVRNTELAVQRSQRILENAQDPQHQFPNPSTSVHKLVEELIQMSPSGAFLFKTNSRG